MTDEADDIQNDASDATAALLREQAEQIGSLRQQVEQQRGLAYQWKAKADETVKEVNDLRAQLMEALLGNERLRGYIEGKREAEPPQMAPVRPRRPEWTEQGPPVEPRARFYGAQAPKPWFAR